ncbi:hypothetical protein F7734_11370 [Scytonema sp. UIC 10036]|uniref:hypothetical protein n=1 Tax=Scytonema sp. UIC 10036 TaxID=2304196 RepID=UPI0012DA26EF|nr:hypothetical protein [Scytonema sp. UIC 10036]MUG93003.1 hypothetical protein [Scytonema sp. UIC 10036]
MDKFSLYWRTLDNKSTIEERAISRVRLAPRAIAQVTGLSVEQVQQLQTQLQLKS